MENQINMGDQNAQQIGQSPISQPMQVPEKPRVSYLMISLIVFICFLIFGLGGYYLGIKNQNKTSDTGNILPTPVVTSPPETTVTPTNIPTTQSTTVKSVLQSITLKVAAIGGGIKIDGYNFTFTFNKESDDTTTVVKRDENEYKNYQGFPQGAIDKGLIIKHGDVELEITPSFEGAGSPIPNKLNPVIISNPKLTDGSIFRLKEKDVVGPQNTTRGGSDYTTQYSEDPAVCGAFQAEGSPKFPACISGGSDIFLRDNNHIAIHCSAENNQVAWCDNVVKNLSVSVSKYTN